MISRLRRLGVEAVNVSRSGQGRHVIPADIGDRSTLQGILTSGDVVIHLANSGNPTTSEQDRVRDIEENLIATLHLLESCAEKGVEKFIFASSGGTVYGVPQVLPIPEVHPTNPISAHGAMKLAIEKYVQVYGAQFGLKYVILRCANAYGPGQTGASGQGIIGRAIQVALQDEPLELWGSGSAVRDFIFVEDVAEAFVLAAIGTASIEVVNIGTGKGTSIAEVIDLVGRAVGRPVQVVHLPGRQFDVPGNLLDIRKAKALLDWEPRTALEEGIKRCHAWASQRLEHSK
ncbi:MAG TPA: NAD-dependent epimerase/dehydratase family protein [Dehalococcoidia bacterium]|nr:NAD-dependent epimerase/dehydratase family protein [Dehalococcoidia bacterium]